MFNLTSQELGALKRLNTPPKIQDFLNSLANNFELKGETCMSPRRVLRERRAHCMEGAMLAALALRLQGQQPIVMDLKAARGDQDHVVTLFKQRGHWGALSKTNHAVLRYREPIYRTLRELALSYFHEYFLDTGRKTLVSYSAPFDLGQFDQKNWMTAEKDLFFIPRALDRTTHKAIAPKQVLQRLRKADAVEIAYGKIIEWDRKGKRLFK